jgi:hypothetical protein
MDLSNMELVIAATIMAVIHVSAMYFVGKYRNRKK